MLGKIEGRRRRGQWRMRCLDGIIDLNGHEFEPALGDGDGQGSLVCCSPWGCKELDMTEELNNNNIYNKIMQFATTWTGPENILLSEVSQQENDKYYDIFYM